VVDDSTISKMILREQLEQFGSIVTLANNGREAIDISDVFIFDAIITDLNMPDLDGYEVAQALRKKGFTGQIIGLTGNAYEEEKERGSALGMNCLLRKPLLLQQLRSLLHSIYKSRR
ncbi:response regulator, partial [Escherichia coli]|nr:response regulator [Escherichia coli]